MLVWEIILAAITLLFLGVATFTDLKKREVPDWVSYSLIFSGLGLRLIFSFEYGLILFFHGLIGLGICFVLACVFYYTNQWGGGDSKLLMGMGAVIGFSWGSFDLLLFFIFLMLSGALIGLIWSIFLAIKYKKRFSKDLQENVKSLKKWHYFSLVLSLVLLCLGIFYPLLMPLFVFPFLFFYSYLFIKTVEGCCFLKRVSVEKLVEGDWLAEDVLIKKKIIAEKDKSLEKKELLELISLFHMGKIKKVLVKEGIPFVPSFLLGYLIVWIWNFF